MENKENENGENKYEDQKLLEPNETNKTTSNLQNSDPRFKIVIEKESRIFDFKKTGITVAAVLLSIIVILLKGGKGIKSIIGIQKCDWEDWTTTAIYTVLCLLLASISILILRSEGEERKAVTGKRSLEIEHSNILFICALVIGFVASVLGIGGATLLTPVLIAYEFSPSTVKATNCYLVFLNKIAASLVFLVLGILHFDYFLVVGTISMVSVALANWGLSSYVKNLGR